MRKQIMNEAISGTTAIVKKFALSTPGPVSLHLVTTATVAGAWSIKASNAPEADVSGDDNAADITDGFETPGGDAIADAAGTALKQYVQADPLAPGVLIVTFTPTSGAGSAICNVNGPSVA